MGRICMKERKWKSFLLVSFLTLVHLPFSWCLLLPWCFPLPDASSCLVPSLHWCFPCHLPGFSPMWRFSLSVISSPVHLAQVYRFTTDSVLVFSVVVGSSVVYCLCPTSLYTVLVCFIACYSTSVLDIVDIVKKQTNWQNATWLLSLCLLSVVTRKWQHCIFILYVYVA